VKEFERQFAESVKAKHAVAVSSCTAALHLALEAIGVGPGDEVILPTLTFASTGEVVQHLGARPVLVDIESDTFLMDPGQIEEKITERTKAVIPVHYAGQPCDLDPIIKCAKAHRLHVIEDAAHAFPARYHDRPVGSIGDVTCFSFYANKTITTGEGGMITTDDDEIAQRCRLMSLHGITKDAWKRFSAEGTWDYEIVAPGYKSNLTDIAAAIGLEQLKKAERLLARRQEIVKMYDEAFCQCAGLKTLKQRDDSRSAWHLYVIQLQAEMLKIDRKEFISQLAGNGIGTSVHYRPLHMHPLYAEKYGYKPEDLPVAFNAFRGIISLPLYASMSDGDVKTVISNVVEIIGRNTQ
jgi:perosamine synthetase